MPHHRLSVRFEFSSACHLHCQTVSMLALALKVRKLSHMEISIHHARHPPTPMHQTWRSIVPSSCSWRPQDCTQEILLNLLHPPWKIFCWQVCLRQVRHKQYYAGCPQKSSAQSHYYAGGNSYSPVELTCWHSQSLLVSMMGKTRWNRRGTGTQIADTPGSEPPKSLDVLGLSHISFVSLAWCRVVQMPFHPHPPTVSLTP